MFIVETFSIFFIGFFLNENFLWMLAPCGKNNMYLGKIFICSFIV